MIASVWRIVVSSVSRTSAIFAVFRITGWRNLHLAEYADVETAIAWYRRWRRSYRCA